MELFIGRLTRDTHIDDLRGFVRKFDKGGVDIRISEIITPDRRLIRFAYINIPSERLALKAVKKLNLNILCDHPVIVREFSQRRSYNDNRDLNWRDKYWFGSERRSAERRGRLIENRQRRMNAA